MFGVNSSIPQIIGSEFYTVAWSGDRKSTACKHAAANTWNRQLTT